MKIGIISDTHDRVENTQEVIKQIKKKDCKVLIHCGDFCSPFMIKELAAFSGDVHCCFGNTDDKFTSTALAEKNKINLHGDLGEIVIDGKKIAFTHLPVFAEGLAATGKFNLVLHGHTHIKRKEKIGSTLLVNPGEIMGYKNKPTYAVYETDKDHVEFFDL